MTETLDRSLPQTADAERAVLGSILIRNEALWRVLPLVDASDFFGSANRALFAMFRQMGEAGTEIDFLTVKDELTRRGTLEQIGGSAFISALVDGFPDSANVERYARMVAEKSKLRRLVKAGHEIMTRALEGEDTPETIAADALADLTFAATTKDAQARSLGEVVDEAYADAEKRLGSDESQFFTTGFSELDGYQAIYPTLIVIGAPSGHGKTGYTINLAQGLAEHGRTVLALPLESTERQMAWRYVSSSSGVPHGKVRDWKRLTEADYPKLAVAQDKAHRLPIYMTRRIRTVEAMYAECRRIKTSGPLDALLVDYVQLVRMQHGPRDREERIALISQDLLEIALDLDIAVIATSQLNKEWTAREDGLLHPTDLKYAAAIGESARVVLMFQRPHVRRPEERSCLVKFQVAKNNEERTGAYEAHFNEVNQRFGDGDCKANDCPRVQIEQPRFAESERYR